MKLADDIKRGRMRSFRSAGFLTCETLEGRARSNIRLAREVRAVRRLESRRYGRLESLRSKSDRCSRENRIPSGFIHQSHSKRISAFTLIEIMVVVVILGILAATIIPQFMGTTQDAKVSAAKANVSELENALERYNIHMDRHPTTEEGLKVLVEAPSGEEKKWRGPYVKMIRPDPWGNPYQYRSPGIHHPTSFDLWSRGADGADGGEGPGTDIGNWQ